MVYIKKNLMRSLIFSASISKEDKGFNSREIENNITSIFTK